MLEAAMAAVDEKLESSKMSIDGISTTIKDVHFELALKKIAPSVSEEVWTAQHSYHFIDIFYILVFHNNIFSVWNAANRILQSFVRKLQSSMITDLLVWHFGSSSIRYGLTLQN